MIKHEDIQKEDLLRVGIIESGCDLYLVKELLDDKECGLFVAPANEEKQTKFVELYKSYKGADGDFEYDVLNIEQYEGDIKDYVCITRNEYQDYLKFKNARVSKKLDEDIQKKIKKRYKELRSQRAIAKEFNVSAATVSRIVNNKY